MSTVFSELPTRVYERYITVERNIKAASNSFYDSYLDLLEELVKAVAEEYSLELGGKRTCGEMMRADVTRQCFLNELGLEEQHYEKALSYVSKINQHKHKLEKKIQIDTIINYVKLFCIIANVYLTAHGREEVVFDADKIIEDYGLFEKQNEELCRERDLLKEGLDEALNAGKMQEKDAKLYRELFSKTHLLNLTLEEKNAQLLRDISQLKDIKLATLEAKLNKTIDLLNELTASVFENRAVSYAVGDSICGRDKFNSYVEKAKNVMPEAKNFLNNTNTVLEESSEKIKEANSVLSKGIDKLGKVIGIFKK